MKSERNSMTETEARETKVLSGEEEVEPSSKIEVEPLALWSEYPGSPLT